MQYTVSYIQLLMLKCMNEKEREREKEKERESERERKLDVIICH